MVVGAFGLIPGCPRRQLTVNGALDCAPLLRQHRPRVNIAETASHKNIFGQWRLLQLSKTLIYVPI